MLDDYERFILSRIEKGETPRDVVDRLMQLNDAPQCKFCGVGIATQLCDHRVARCIETMEDLVCSTPICKICAVEGGVLFFSGTEGGIDTLDFCPKHNESTFGEMPEKIVTRKELYCMESAGEGLILNRGLQLVGNEKSPKP